MADTVEYGIDLGTTNSAISRMTAKGAEVIPVRRLNYIPSAVAIDKRGDLKVGSDALNPHLQCARWFKRLMGTTSTLTLADGEEWTPERLSAEVLKALKAAVKLKTREDIEDVVITVPAMFTQPQCAATNEAARLAGLNAVTLLQEPIAAATAYLSENPVEGYHLVYDLGGGTFDVSLIRLHAGEMNVVEHGGDNYLGGVDFDRAVFDWTLMQIDRKGGETEQFQDGAKRHQLLTACEDARVALSDSESATIYLDEFNLPIAKLELTRERLEDLLEDFVSRTIEIARDRLHAVPAGSEAVRGILLVGGPTQMPYIRRRLEEELGIPLNLDQDPMTVVAKGAAIHAGTILKRDTAMPGSAKTGEARLELYYDPVSPDRYTTVAGKIAEPEGFRGEIRLASARGDWETGWTTLVNGAFSTEVSLGQQQLSEFNIQLRDLSGRIYPCTPSSFVIRSGVRAAQGVTPYNYGVVLEGGTKVGIVVPKGQSLPSSGFETFRLAKTLVAGSPEAARIYFIEGLSVNASDNTKVGHLDIKGTDIRRTLKENERIEIRVRMDESRRLKATVYIPLLDEDYTIELHSVVDAPNYADLEASLTEARIAISEVEDHVDLEEQELVMRAERQIEQIEATLERAERGEVGEAERILKQLSDTKASIRPLRDKYAIRARHASIVEFIGEAEELCRQFSDHMGLAKLQDLRADADKALRLDREKALDAVFDRVRDVFWAHYGKTRECWEYQVDLMRERAHLASDTLTYYEMVRRAEKALAANDYGEVSIQSLRAWELLPEQERLRNRFHDAALRSGHS